MTHGLRLTGTLRDLAALRALGDAPAELMKAPWTEITAAGAPGSVVASEQLDAKTASALRSRGLDVVRVRSVGATCAFDPVGGGEHVLWHGAVGRTAPSLLEALRPVRSSGDPVVDEACFVVAPEAPGAQQILERLLTFGRDDVSVAEWEDKGARSLLVQVPRPPMYLLMRAREEPAEGVRAFARAGGDDGALWVEWSYAHPLEHAASRWLRSGERAAFVDASGRWRFAPARWTTRTIYDAIIPRLEAPRVELAPEPGESRFTIRLRLGAAPENTPEMWLLAPEQFFSLETLIESATDEEIARLTVSRMSGPRGTSYVLREIVRPNAPRLGTRVSDLVGVRGFARAPGTDNLFLPTGRRLVPTMRRDELRKLLALDQSHFVLLDEDRDGPRVIAVRAVDEVSLARWIDYVATDRRVELDRMLESSVFELPALSIERPAKRERERAEKERDERDAVRPPRAAPAPRPAREQRDEPARITAVEVTADEAALREEIRTLERGISEGGCDASATWQTLGALKTRVRQYDEAGLCLEAALFHSDGDGPAAAALARALADARGAQIEARGTLEELVDLAVRPQLLPGEAAYLGARVVDLTLRGDPAGETVAQQVLKVFADGDLPVSRRLAWLVLAAHHRKTRDALGITRAKERTLGRINDRGLDEAYDLPGFVRFALALGDTGASGASERVRGEQLTVLDDLWRRATARFVTEEIAGSSLPMFLRLLFAVGYTRLGVGARAKDLIGPVEAQSAAHEAPNQALYRLYMARLAHAATQGTSSSWEREVETLLAGVKENRVKDKVEWLRRRSEWLRTATPEETTPVIRPQLDRLLAGGEADAAQLADSLSAAFALPQLFDYEMKVAVERVLRAALRSGNEAAIDAALSVAQRKAGTIQILGHRAGALGACIRAAATLGDAQRVDALLDDVIAIATAPNVPSVRDLLLAVNPGVAALRRLGAGDAAGRLLDALAPVAAKGGRDGVRLQAALADGYLQLRDADRASELVDKALDDTLRAPLDHVGRYEGGAAVLAALVHWPMAQRGPRCAKLFEGLEAFEDTFTTRRLYETHRVLILERLIDAITDDVTFRTDRVQGFLDREEQVIRRRILHDWRNVCGR